MKTLLKAFQNGFSKAIFALFIVFFSSQLDSQAQIAGWYNVSSGTFNSTTIMGGDTTIFFGIPPGAIAIGP